MRSHNKAAILASTAAIIVTVIAPALPAKADQVRDSQWFVSYLKLEEAHKISQGAGVSIAVVDTGVSAHRDLTRNLKKGTDFGPDGDGTGQVDSVGHGTRMAGLIAGHGHGSGNGVIGIAPRASIVPVKASGKIGNGPYFPASIEWAAKSGAGVINVSADVGRSRDLSAAITAAVKEDSVVVAASGNTSDDLSIAHPAALPEVLAVGAIDRNGKVAKFSVTDPKVGICAPGVDMVTTDLNNKYSKSQGTSQAAAIVSGAAALVRAKFPGLSAPEVVHRLTATADDNGPPGKDDECGYGVLNIVKALTADAPPLTPSGSGSASVPSGSGSAPAGGAPASAGSAAPGPESSGIGVAAVAGIGGAVAVLVGLLAFVAMRRRRVSS
ncbi:S8 family serine peptidase [Actinoplanes derwentensis]|uniref:Type VII secretion-associated serine protease mycosin n=1 Tax=Actinoplanes derwentensis TaxID=113562 RepID=A0A1H2D174_9ACTN|nr:S8 family serine peptidase [Actinoplanes derwentensis]GID90002.1 type VII secretion-associated serine protease [Actinoplanes derwentensis]SDT76473.1 type VII secretion-associated serine protease mycosin [Actinoplanes derwentensis]